MSCWKTAPGRKFSSVHTFVSPVPLLLFAAKRKDIQFLQTPKATSTPLEKDSGKGPSFNVSWCRAVCIKFAKVLPKQVVFLEAKEGLHFVHALLQGLDKPCRVSACTRFLRRDMEEHLRVVRKNVWNSIAVVGYGTEATSWRNLKCKAEALFSL